MKLPRNARIFHGQLDVAPFAGVFFLLVLFVLLSALVYTPGVTLNLPRAEDLPGLDSASVAVAVDARGQLYFDNQAITPPAFLSRLRAVVRESREPLTLVVQADKNVSYETLIRVSTLARDAGITQALLATLPPNSAPGPVLTP